MTLSDSRGGVLDIALRRGQSWELPLTIDVDLTGASIVARIFDGDGVTVVSITTDITSAINGEVTLSLTASQTRALVSTLVGEDTSLRWGVVLVDTSARRIPLMSGVVILSPELVPA